MELDELHVDELGSNPVRQRMAVAGAFPAVAGHPEGPSNATRRKNDRLGGEHMKGAALAVVGQDAGRTPLVEDDVDDGVLHVHRHAEVDRVVLQRANQLETRAVADVRQARIPWPPKLRWLIRPSLVRSNTAPHASSSRTRSGASLA